jgi:alkylation response protein AidB-like acyl-CoA dehydrogenase
MGLNVSADYGGTQAGTVALALAIEELAHACSATAGTASVTNMVGEVIQATGSEDQKRQYLPRLADGHLCGGRVLPHRGRAPARTRPA